MTEVEMAMEMFQKQMDDLKRMKKWRTKDLAERLQCDERTVQRMRSDPLTAGGRKILMVQGMLLMEEAKRKRELERSCR